jgi:hypothetical protein
VNIFKRAGKAVKQAGRAVDVSSSKSYTRKNLVKLDKTVGGKEGWMATGVVAAGVALTVTGNPALGLGLAAKGVQGLAAVKAGTAVQGDPSVPATDYAEGAVAGDPRAAGPAMDPVGRVDTPATKAPGTSAPASSSPVIPGGSSSLWSRIKAIFTPPPRRTT